MIPQIGQHVKCLLKSGTLVEGIVENWSQQSVQLKSLDGESILIITHAADDITLIKIMLHPFLKKSEIIKQNKTELQKEFDQTYEKPSNDDLRVKKMADLKILLDQQDKKIIAEKLKGHHIVDVKKVEYGYPRIFKKQGS